MDVHHVVAVTFYTAYVAGTVYCDDVAIARSQWIGVVVTLAAVCSVLFNAWYCLFFAVTTITWNAVLRHWMCVMVDSVAVQTVS